MSHTKVVSVNRADSRVLKDTIGILVYSTQDDRNMRVIAMNCLWHLFSDLLTSVRSFTPNPNELLLNPHLIILEHLKNPNNQQIISIFKEEFSRTTENPEVDRFVSLIFSKLPAWKLMVICLDLKKKSYTRYHGSTDHNKTVGNPVRVVKASLQRISHLGY